VKLFRSTRFNDIVTAGEPPVEMETVGFRAVEGERGVEFRQHDRGAADLGGCRDEFAVHSLVSRHAARRKTTRCQRFWSVVNG
jgi:hypothetical protein